MNISKYLIISKLKLRIIFSRPQGSAWGIGAYEYAAAVPPPDTTPLAAPSGVVVN
ncbi:MAG: hypothetical protein WC618_01210 [Patescibacteria group bacterium]